MQLKVVKTFVTRFLILILSFGLVIYTTNMWGTVGKGMISIVVANVAIVSFFSSIFAGSSTSFFASKYKTEHILVFSYLWSVLIGILVPLIFSFVSFQQEYLFYLIGISIFSSLLSTHINLFVGTQNIRLFNIYTVLQQLLHIVFIVLLVYVFNKTNLSAYFLAQICCYGLLFVISFLQIIKKCSISEISFSGNVFKSMLEYGWKNQLSAFIQFLNYRLSFYFLEYFEGIAAVGIFSIGITFSEAIWTITRSIAVILYSDVVNSKSPEESIIKTKTSLRISCMLMVLFILGIIVIPSQTYPFIFGEAFRNTKEIMLILSPGIFAIALSDMVGYYFSGIRELNILNIKSIAGLMITVGLSFIAIPRWGIFGACMVTTVSYCFSAAILFWKFYKTTDFHLKDYLISKSEINVFLQKFKKK